ncbi:hypothetical protein BLNAU_17772 [Blattamonas nauphoetae]|uniref:Uncharacterized protein n=1 Tax=Blattamonas nauphoetae TaxID=2049346 RepID=A0ABQ9X697_9EUKA|nr:hypothetical protein BLNAU_17772 [Blattamonas nauphoetae]
MLLFPTEVNHAIRFLKYAAMHIERNQWSDDKLLKTIFPKENDRPIRLMSSLINLLSLSSDPLRAAVISFFDVGLCSSKLDFSCAITATGLLVKLFLVLKPHEMPFNDTTIEFHDHLVSIVGYILRCSSPEQIIDHLRIDKANSRDRKRVSKIIEPTYQSLCAYLQFLVDTPVSRPDHRSGFMFLFHEKLFSPFRIKEHCKSSSPALQRFFGGIQRNMTNEFDSVFGHASTNTIEKLLNGGRLDSSDTHSWVAGFEHLLGRVREGKTLSDFAVEVVRDFLSECPTELLLVFWSDDTFGFQLKGQRVSSSELDSTALWTLFTPSQPKHATSTLTTFTDFMISLGNVACWQYVWKGWFPRFRNAVDPSKLPFTSKFTKLHTKLVKLFKSHYLDIRDYEWKMKREKKLTDEVQREIDELHLVFFRQTKDYIVHLSLHPFALIDDRHEDPILDFLRYEYLRPTENSLMQQSRAEFRKEIDASELSLSPAPFILTSELVFRLTDEEIINIVDRIVARLASDSPLDDDIIRRIFAFHRMALHPIYLPQLFRKFGRSTEQYFHALESLLSLHVEFYDRAPIYSLLFTRPDEHQPTFDEWDDVDLETGLILMRVFNKNPPSVDSRSPDPTALPLSHAIHCLPLMRHCSARHQQHQLERLISPSIDILCTYLIGPSPYSRI